MHDFSDVSQNICSELLLKDRLEELKTHNIPNQERELKFSEKCTVEENDEKCQVYAEKNENKLNYSALSLPKPKQTFIDLLEQILQNSNTKHNW